MCVIFHMSYIFQLTLHYHLISFKYLLDARETSSYVEGDVFTFEKLYLFFVSLHNIMHIYSLRCGSIAMRRRYFCFCVHEFACNIFSL